MSGDGRTWRVSIDRDRCVGSGNCVFWAPGSFALEDDGISVSLDTSDDDLETVTVAVEGCPTRSLAIVFEDASPGERE